MKNFLKLSAVAAVLVGIGYPLLLPTPSTSPAAVPRSTTLVTFRVPPLSTMPILRPGLRLERVLLLSH